MKNYFKETLDKVLKQLPLLLILSVMIVSCDKYIYDDGEPDWLGASIYDYLKSNKNFTNYVKLIEDLDYIEVLGKTGSKTLFVANDSAFNEFYKNNDWGVTNYEQLTLSQKKIILFFGMINNAYLVDMLANYNNNGTLKEGAAMRRTTAVSVLDSLPFNSPLDLPATANWDYYRPRGLYLLKDNTPWTMICFTQKQLEQAQISNEDFKLITGVSRTENDAHIFGVKIIQKDITCKNGYLNVLEKVLLPPTNMAEYIYTNKNTSIFSSFLERFSAPVYDADNTLLQRQIKPQFSDSIFVKKYFAKIGGITSFKGQSFNSEMLLPFDPGWNSYERTASGNALESDMAAMFVPTDEAMNKFFNSGAGAVLKDRFQSWDNVPNDILPLFIKRHMRSSLVESVPSRFATMVDEDNSPLPVNKSDVEKVYVGSNGVVYLTNKVYPPDDYGSVYGPVLLSANNASSSNKTKIWNWAINQNDFRLYLNSMVSRYSFFVITDEYFKNYIEPVAIGKDVPGALKFWYNEKQQTVNATVYKYFPETKTFGDSVASITSSSFLVNRLLDLLNSHIVVNGVEHDKKYYITKGNVALKVDGSGNDMTIEGGGNVNLDEKVKVNKNYHQSNGYTYFIDRPIQAPLTSVYKVLSQTPEFSAFFNLLAGFPSSSASVIFVKKQNFYGVDFNVKFFNTFNYTVYVPTNSAINKAIEDGLIKPWESQGAIVGINSLTDATEKVNAIANLERFIRYHFQDNSVFVDNRTLSAQYQSATMKLDNNPSHFGTFKNKYYKIGVDCTPGNMSLTTEKNDKAQVITTDGLFNIMTRDFIFSNTPSSFKNIDGSGSGTDFSLSQIYTSSTAVIHQVNKVLNFQ